MSSMAKDYVLALLPSGGVELKSGNRYLKTAENEDLIWLRHFKIIATPFWWRQLKVNEILK